MVITPPKSTGTTPGIVVIGPEAQCGKTVATAGLALSLIAGGLRVLPLKPYWSESQNSAYAKPDLMFLSHVTQNTPYYQPLICDTPYRLRQSDWNRIQQICRQSPQPVLLDTSHSATTPIFYDTKHDTCLTALDLANALGMAVVVVIRKSDDLLGTATPLLTTIKQTPTHIAGFLCIETQTTSAPHMAFETTTLSQKFDIPYLGLIPYSPSISVAQGLAGNLLELTQEHIDLLPLQQAMGLFVR